MFCKTEDFINFFAFIANISGLKDSKMLFFDENNLFENTQIWKVSVVTLNIFLIL